MPSQIIADTAAVATHHPHGTSAGLEMLREGGNAIDAAVAAILALSVVVPGSVGLGGYGGSAVIHLARPKSRNLSAVGRHQNKSAGRQSIAASQQPRVVAVDFDSRAPLEFRNGLVTADPLSSYYGSRSVTIPAVVAGLDLILREFGTMSWSEVSQPAIRLAENGFDVDSEHRRYLDRCAPNFDRQSLNSLFPAGTVPEIGDRWKQPEMARLLRRLADEGPRAFYEGDIAEQVVRYLRDRGGILTEEDFHSYRPQIVEAIHATCYGIDLYTPPPPSGGITALGIVQTIERFGLNGIEPWSGPFFHFLAEAMKTCWKERHEFLGDPDSIRIPIKSLVSAAAAETRAAKIRAGDVIRGRRTTNVSPHTVNVLALDPQGNLISLTATQGWMYGSHLVVDGLGLVLNHGMSRFDYAPGHPNAPEAGKRMQHNMSPTIALWNSRPAFAWGMPGGPKIVNVTAQLILDTVAFGATPAAAVAAPRMHTEGNEPLLVSKHTPNHVVAELEQLGHAVCREEDMGGPVNVLAVDRRSRKIDVASGEGTGAVAGY